MGTDEFSSFLERKNPTIIGEGVDDDCGILARFDNLIEIAYRAVADCHGEGTIMPDGSLSVQQIAAHEVRGCHVLVTGNGYKGTLKDKRHVFHKACLAATGRPLEHDRHT